MQTLHHCDKPLLWGKATILMRVKKFKAYQLISVNNLNSLKREKIEFVTLRYVLLKAHN